MIVKQYNETNESKHQNHLRTKLKILLIPKDFVSINTLELNNI